MVIDDARVEGARANARANGSRQQQRNTFVFHIRVLQTPRNTARFALSSARAHRARSINSDRRFDVSARIERRRGVCVCVCTPMV